MAEALPLGAEDQPALRQPANKIELFRVFNRLALQGFGGVLPVAHRHLVERERWLSPTQFLDLLTLSQVLPGPNIVNMALMIGDRFMGRRGALAACTGLLLLPLLIVLSLVVLYQQAAHLPWVAGALRGMGAVAAGLIFAIALKLAPSLRLSPLGWPAAAALAAATAVMVGVLRWPMAWVVLGLGSLGMAGAGWRLRQRMRP